MTNKSKATKENLWMPEAKCPMCGKIFIPAPLHTYKEHDIFYCSWRCLSHARAGATKIEKRTSPPVEMIDVDGVCVETFKDSLDAAIFVDGLEYEVRAACREEKLYKEYMWRYKREK